jgi:tetratricopeptide (TPR) repeat protein
MFGLMLLAALAAYHPALHGTFLWDDSGHVTRADLRSLSGLARIWFELGATQQYYPLLHSAFWLEHKLWGDATLGYHLVNVLQHAAAATLFGLLLRRLAVPGAWLAAWLFLLHPVCVESVAWISEQKNTLSLLLYLAAALAYLGFHESRAFRHYVLATLLFCGALLTKTVTASLPAALLVVTWWRHGRIGWRRDVVPLLPWFVLGVASGLLTAWFERKLIGAEGADFTLGLLDRFVLAGRVIWFYLGNLLWPANLTFIYPRWTVDASVWWQWLFPVAALAALGGLCWWRARSPGPLAAALLFGGSLFPVLGFFNVYPFIYSYVADHFQYLASLALFALAAAALTRLPRPAFLATGAGLLSLCAVLTWRQAGMYRDVFTLYETTLRRNPDCWMAHNNLGMELSTGGRHEEARRHFEAALRLRPDYAEALNNLGYTLTQLGRAAEALPLLERAVRLKPAYVDAHNNRGIALMALERAAEGEAAFRRALWLSPAHALAHRNLAQALASSGRADEALGHFARAASLAPADAETERQWAVALALLGRMDEAAPHFERAVMLAPGWTDALYSYGRALAHHRRWDEALARFQAVLALNPNLAEAHLNAALVLRQLGRLEEANSHYREGLRLKPSLGRQP